MIGALQALTSGNQSFMVPDGVHRLTAGDSVPSDDVARSWPALRCQFESTAAAAGAGTLTIGVSVLGTRVEDAKVASQHPMSVSLAPNVNPAERDDIWDAL